MRILLAAHAMPPASTAGVEVYTLRLARALRGLGHGVQVLTAAHDLAARPYEVRTRSLDGVEVFEVVNVHHKGTLEATYDDPDVDQKVSGLLDRLRPDVVHLQHLLNLSGGIVAAAKRRGSAVLLTLHDYWLSCPRDGLRMRADLVLCRTMDHRECARCLAQSPYIVPTAQRGLSAAARGLGLGRQLHRLHDLAPGVTERALRLLRRASPAPTDLQAAMDRRAEKLRAVTATIDLVVAPTTFAAERAIEFGVPRDRLRVVPLGVVTGPAPRQPARRRWRLGYVGTLAPHKGVNVLVEAFLGMETADATLDLYGSETVHPSFVRSLRSLAEGHPRVRFRGAFPEGEQAKVLAEIDILVLPSIWWENSPLVVLEALAAGVPVIATDTGGVRELVGSFGILVPPGDVAALRAALDDAVRGRTLVDPPWPAPVTTIEQGAQALLGLYESART